MGGVLLKGGCVLSLDKRIGNLHEADVLIEDGKVAEIAAVVRARDAEVVDATDTIVMPGFVDTHRHAWRSLFRNLAVSAEHASSADDLAQGCQPDDVYAGTLVSLLTAAQVGITTVVDWSDIQLGEPYTEAVLQAHADAGLRTVFVHAVPAWASELDDPDRSSLRRLVAERGGDRRATTTIAFGTSHPTLADADRVAAQWSLARELGLRIHAHAGTDASERGTVADLARRGLLDRDVTLVHCSHLGDTDLDAIAEHEAAVSLAPAHEMITGLGPPPLQSLIDREIRPGLGIGDDVAAPSDLFAQMRSAQSLQHAVTFDLKLAGKAGLPQLLGTRDVIRYATVDGAKAAGLSDVTGSLAPGMEADIVVLRTDRPNIHPINDPIGAVVWGMDASNVDWVFVGGRPVVRNGALDADVARARDLVTAARQRLATAEDPLVETGDGGAR